MIPQRFGIIFHLSMKDVAETCYLFTKLLIFLPGQTDYISKHPFQCYVDITNANHFWNWLT